MRRTHCKRGHALEGDNVYVAPKSGGRSCKTCNFARASEHARKYRDLNDFDGVREKAIERDGEECVSCGMTREEHYARWNRDITVDHINGRGRYTPKHLKDNSLENLQTLCLSCHGKKDIQRRKPLPPWTDERKKRRSEQAIARFKRLKEEGV